MSAAIQGGRSIWTQMCNISIRERCYGPVEQADCWKHEAHYVSATHRAHICVNRSYLHGGVRVTWTRTCQLSPLPPIAEGMTACTPEHAGRGEKGKRREEIFRPSKMGEINKYLSTSHRYCVIYQNKHCVFSWKKYRARGMWNASRIKASRSWSERRSRVKTRVSDTTIFFFYSSSLYFQT